MTSDDKETRPKLPRDTTESAEIHLSVKRTVAWRKSWGRSGTQIAQLHMGKTYIHKLYYVNVYVLCK